MSTEHAREAGHTQGAPVRVPTRDGRSLYAMVLPAAGDRAGAPAVVFEAGAAATRSTWALVQTRVAEFARAIVYDRSGLGLSGPDPAGRTLDRMADDLNDLLDHVEPGPFVLVGHSAGGPIVRLAASRRPERVAGLVLVDPSDEAADVLFSHLFRAAELPATRLMALSARLGLLQRGFRFMLDAMPADVADDLRREAFQPSVFATQARQGRTFLDELHAWREMPPALGDIPVTIVSGGLAKAGDGMPRRVRTAAIASHSERAAQSPQGRHVIAERSGHYVPITEPALIAAEVRQLVQPTNQ
ncbi:alpha/beta fold hydrolase [Microbacterium sp.]|uniref:alpha/beta fold hydrolase n=1 Tax=Microbacterium sp. TaxID=51671 RepID=UPI003F980B97